jgi:hypothetical protein
MNDTMTDAELARLGYEAYAVATGGKTFDGRDMPQWDAITPRIQGAWRAAAKAIAACAGDA